MGNCYLSQSVFKSHVDTAEGHQRRGDFSWRIASVYWLLAMSVGDCLARTQPPVGSTVLRQLDLGRMGELAEPSKKQHCSVASASVPTKASALAYGGL